MSRAQTTALAMARRRCKIRTRKMSSRGRTTEAPTSQDTDEPVQKDTIHRTGQDANTQIYGGHDESSQLVFLDQDEIDRQNQEGDDEEVDELNENDEFGMYLVELYSTLEDTEWEERPELQAEYVGSFPKNEGQRLTSVALTASCLLPAWAAMSRKHGKLLTGHYGRDNFSLIMSRISESCPSTTTTRSRALRARRGLRSTPRISW